MDLWIRSQDRLRLVIANNLSVGLDGTVYHVHDKIGAYRNIDKAVEVLDEIQKLLTGASRIILQPKITPINHELLGYVNKELACDACIVPQEFNCLAVNQSVVIYEMPKE